MTNPQDQETLNLKEQLKAAQDKIMTLEAEIAWMKTSKFWKLRQLWMKVKPIKQNNQNIEEVSLSSQPNTPETNQGFSPLAKLAIKKRQWIGKIKFWRKLWMNRSPKTPTLPEPINNQEINYKEQLSHLYQVELDSFLISGKNISFPTTENPLVSIILVLHNRAELTFQCLRSLMTVALNSEHPCEIILVDNGSQDQTDVLLEQLFGVTKILNRENLHFLAAMNQASKVAKGSYLLMLNNDAQMLPGTLSAALDTYNSANDIGAVGGKIILLDGTLQEAGSIIWNDGSCLGYGRGNNPFDYSYMFQRDVDYCSGAFLLTERNLFLEMGGFDEDYKPAYYEETDYCLRLWERGKRVVYEPNATIIHFEFASAQSNESAINLQQAHQSIFTQKHSQQLANDHLPPAQENIFLARTHAPSSHRILFIDDRVPHAFLGSGFPRSRDILQALVSLDYCVTFYPLNFPEESWTEVYKDIPKVVEVVLNQGIGGLEEFLRHYAQFYDLILISRPHNMEILNPILMRHPQWFEKTRIIYDAEAIYALREVSQRQTKGKSVSQHEKNLLVKTEIKLAEKADAIVTVSEQERKHFTETGLTSVYTLGHTVDLKPTPKKFDERRGIVFVGAIHDIDSPNADSVFWFAKEILPLLQEKIGKEVTFTVVGFNKFQEIWDLQSDALQVLGQVESLEEIYNCARVFVAPTRFAAGIPFKVHHAAAYGLPIVTTSIIASQLGWQDQQEILVGDDPKSFAEKCAQVYTDQKLWETLRNSALNKIQLECSRDSFVQQVETIINSQLFKKR